MGPPAMSVEEKFDTGEQLTFFSELQILFP